MDKLVLTYWSAAASALPFLLSLERFVGKANTSFLTSLSVFCLSRKYSSMNRATQESRKVTSEDRDVGRNKGKIFFSRNSENFSMEPKNPSKAALNACVPYTSIGIKFALSLLKFLSLFCHLSEMYAL